MDLNHIPWEETNPPNSMTDFASHAGVASGYTTTTGALYVTMGTNAGYTVMAEEKSANMQLQQPQKAGKKEKKEKKKEKKKKRRRRRRRR